MIDYVKLSFYSKALASKYRSEFCHVLGVDHTTGEAVDNIYRGEVNGMRVTVYPSDRIVIDGSLHKFYEGGTNCSDFNFTMCRKAITDLSELLSLNPMEVKVDNLEFGVNVELSYSPQVVLSSIVCLVNGKPFVPQQGGGLKCCLGEYRHKVYNKSSQYNLKETHLLRYEIHVDKMRRILAVKTLHDLTKLEVWISLEHYLLKRFNQIIFAEMYRAATLTASEAQYVKRFGDKLTNIRFWREITPRTRHYHKLNLEALQRTSGSGLKESLSESIKAKLRQLMCV